MKQTITYKDKMDFKIKVENDESIIKFARQFGYNKAIELYKIWEKVNRNTPKFIFIVSRNGYTPYAFGRFLDAISGEY